MNKTTITKEKISPALASRWLKQNKGNRPLRSRHISWLASQIQQGKWCVNGSTVKFDSQGRLLDGQHRLAACVKANKAFESYVINGINGNTFATIDTGKNRTGGDMLALKGEKYYNELSAAIKYHLAIKSRQHKARYGITNLRVLSHLKAHSGLRSSVKWAVERKKHLKKVGLPVSLLTALHYACCKKCKKDANTFFNKLLLGTDCKKQDPVYHVREELISLTANKDIKSMRVSNWYRAHLVLKAWNMFREKEYCSQPYLVVTADEKFPAII